jgi:hypothetical protein
MESFTNLTDLKKSIPSKVQTHLAGLLKETGLANDKEAMKKLMEAWLLKKALFHKMTEHEQFARADSMAKDGKNGCIAITYSGSIVSIGPLHDNKREIKYTSIGMRTDVPEAAAFPQGELAADVACDKSIVFKKGPIEKTSPIMDLAIMPAHENHQEQLVSIKKATKKLKDDFIKVNKDTLAKEAKTDAVSARNDLFRKWIIITWFLLGGMEKHIFMARAKLLWLELFNGVYKALSKKIKGAQQRDAAFLDFTNARFAKFIDEYKWYESEKKNFDIGLMKALEELPEYKPYLEFAAVV